MLSRASCQQARFSVSMDYLYCRTDEPRGKLYDYRPQALKEALLRLMTEGVNEE